MHERPHHHHLHVFLSHKQPQAFGNISRLGCECRELAINPVPGKIGSWRHTVYAAVAATMSSTACLASSRGDLAISEASLEPMEANFETSAV